MKLNDPRGRPSASQVNRLIDAVDSSNESLMTLGWGLGDVTIWKHLMQQTAYAIEDYAVRCEVPGWFADDHPAINGYHLVKGRPKKLGLTRAMAQDIYSLAHIVRHDYDPSKVPGTAEPVIDAYGRLRYRETQAADFMLSPVGNTLGWVSGYKDTGLPDPDNPGFNWYIVGDWYGDTEPTGEHVIPTGTTYTDPITGEVLPENWESGGHDGGAPCTHDPPQWYARFASLANTVGGIDAQGPGWHAVYPDNGLFIDWPHRFYATQNYDPIAPGGNFIGVYPAGLSEEVGQPSLGSGVTNVKVDISASFSFNELLASLPEGSTILDAKLEVKVSDLEYGQGSYADTFLGFVDGVPQWGDPTGDYQVSTSTQGIILIGGYVKGVQSRDWQVLGSVNADSGISSDEWQVVDVTGLIQGLIDDHTNSKFTHFSFAPSMATEGLGIMFDGAAGYLSGISWKPTYACVEHPDNQTPWKDGWGYGFNEDGEWVFGNWGADVEYISSSSYSHVSWSNCEFGKLSIRWQYPDSEYGREAIPVHMCPAN